MAGLRKSDIKGEKKRVLGRDSGMVVEERVRQLLNHSSAILATSETEMWIQVTCWICLRMGKTSYVILESTMRQLPSVLRNLFDILKTASWRKSPSLGLILRIRPVTSGCVESDMSVNCEC